ncbi:MAG TPA: DUF2924 domain-containing protein [Rhizomicrobium sp.]|nr:DUF2924 domain-containing protein [Rhizomicrobium sp.]
MPLLKCGLNQINKHRLTAFTKVQLTPTDSIASELTSLTGLSIDALRKLWKTRLGTAPPRIQSSDVLRRIFAWQLQARTFGEPDASSARQLRQIADALERDGNYEPQIRRDVSPGVVLTREWKGVTHKVTATAGGFEHLGKHYRSLSDIARTITGTRWSGPRFFGLEQKSARSAQRTKA